MIEEEEKRVVYAKHTTLATNKYCNDNNKKHEDFNDEDTKTLKNIIQKAVDLDPFEENFQEAIKHAFKVYSKQYIPDEVIEILQDERTTKLTKDSSNFWFMANGLKKFHEEFGYITLSGKIPDMESSSINYINLQKIVKKQQH